MNRDSRLAVVEFLFSSLQDSFLLVELVLPLKDGCGRVLHPFSLQIQTLVKDLRDGPIHILRNDASRRFQFLDDLAFGIEFLACGHQRGFLFGKLVFEAFASSLVSLLRFLQLFKFRFILFFGFLQFFELLFDAVLFNFARLLVYSFLAFQGNDLVLELLFLHEELIQVFLSVFQGMPFLLKGFLCKIQKAFPLVEVVLGVMAVFFGQFFFLF
mmetsp:Transcript_21298/g.52775  ORF Transcript_21298/g.52775 Transcript_21298/m.52775 type:complete len:213 (+) Transcript_21298:416-1054(+)